MWQQEPVVAERGVMLDISRDRVPNARGLQDLQHLARDVRLTQVQLYSEHAIAYRGHESVTTPDGCLSSGRANDLCPATGGRRYFFGRQSKYSWPRRALVAAAAVRRDG